MGTYPFASEPLIFEVKLILLLRKRQKTLKNFSVKSMSASIFPSASTLLLVIHKKVNYMKTWILVAAATGATVYLYDSINQRLQFSRKIKSPYLTKTITGNDSRQESFAQYLADEMDVACGTGTNATFALFGDSDMLSAVLRNLSQQTRSVLVRASKVSSVVREAMNSDLSADPGVANRILRLVATAA